MLVGNKMCYDSTAQVFLKNSRGQSRTDGLNLWTEENIEMTYSYISQFSFPRS